MRKIIEGDVRIDNLCLTELFDLSDVEVTDDFTCIGNDLTNLKGAPHTVGGNFFCYNNINLTSLEGAPHTVGGNFDCSENNLINLYKGAPHTVGGNFHCYDNDLSSLSGAPQTVGGDFYCHYNNLTSLEGLPETIDGNFVFDRYLKDKFPEEYIRSLSKIKGVVGYI